MPARTVSLPNNGSSVGNSFIFAVTARSSPSAFKAGDHLEVMQRPGVDAGMEQSRDFARTFCAVHSGRLKHRGSEMFKVGSVFCCFGALLTLSRAF
jgi:hypothetical protein